MTARYEQVREDMEGGAPFRVYYCAIGRVRGYDRLGKCRKTPPDGPCWAWLDEHGTEPDPGFANRGTDI